MQFRNSYAGGSDQKRINPYTRDVSPNFIDENGRFVVRPAAAWSNVSRDARILFAFRHGMYVLPTTELVDRLQAIIGGRTAIEIGSGSGALAAALGITGTDNHMQADPKYKRMIEDGNLMQPGQPTVTYGPDVAKLDGNTAVDRLQPQVVIAAWVTHRYDPAQHWRAGNEVGVDEAAVIAGCETYVFVGHTTVHKSKPIWALPHTIEYPAFIRSRGLHGKDFIATWPGGRPPRTTTGDAAG